MRVRTNMTRDVMTVNSDDSLSEAYSYMRDYEFRHVPVLDGDRLVGILSEKDVFLHSDKIDGELRVKSVTVGEVMTKHPVTCMPSTSIAHAARLMNDNKISCLPVVSDDDSLIGLITTTDLLELLSSRGDMLGYVENPFTYRIQRLGATEIAI